MPKLSRKTSDRIFIGCVVTPAMLFFGLVIYYPFFKNVYYMFFDYNYIKEPVFVGWDNIIRFFHDSQAHTAFRNTFVITLCSVPLVISVALVLAVAVFNLKIGRNFVRSSLFVTYLVPAVVAGVVFKLLFGTEIGFINVFLQSVGLNRVEWLTSPGLATLTIVLVHLWNHAGYYMVIFLSGLSNIDTQLYEAAKVDGAGTLRTFFSITVPQLKPSIIFSAIYATISYMKTYAIVQILTEGGPYRSTETVIKYMFDIGFGSREVGYASVISVALFLVMLVIALIQIKVTRYMDE